MRRDVHLHCLLHVIAITSLLSCKPSQTEQDSGNIRVGDTQNPNVKCLTESPWTLWRDGEKSKIHVRARGAMVGDAVLVPNAQDQIAVLDARTGQLRRRIQFELPLLTGVSVHADRLFVGGGHNAGLGYIWCADIATGKIVWSAETARAKPRALSFDGSDDRKILAASDAGYVHSIERSTGNLLHSKRLFSGTGDPCMAVEGSKCVIGFGNQMAALSTVDLAIEWSLSLANDDHPPAGIEARQYAFTQVHHAGKVIYALKRCFYGDRGDSLLLCEAASGNHRTFLERSRIESFSVGSDGLVYLRLPGGITAVTPDAKDVWSRKLVGLYGDSLVSGTSVFCAKDSSLYVLNASTGNLQAVRAAGPMAEYILGNTTSIVMVSQEGRIMGFPFVPCRPNDVREQVPSNSRQGCESPTVDPLLACRDNLTHLWQLQLNYVVQFGGPQKQFPAGKGAQFWLQLTRTTPPLLDRLETLACPEARERPQAGPANYRGPGTDINTAPDGTPVACCPPSAHRDGRINVLLKYTGVVTVKPGDVLYARAMSGTE